MIRPIVPFIYSSAFSTRTDDALKDEDNAGWLMRLSEPVRSEWLTVLEWLRSADRLVEQETYENLDAAYGYRDFMRDWSLLRAGVTPIASPFRSLFDRLAKRWKHEGTSELELVEWDLYLHSLWHYRHPEHVIHTMADYRVALHDMSAGIFHALPFQPECLHDAVGVLGAIDQFFNNLRDLSEDTSRGICYFPDDLLGAFGIERAEMPALVCTTDERFARMHEHLLGTLVPDLLKRAAPLFSASRLHPSWVEMLHNLRMRHARIEYVARGCRFNATAFSTEYWACVERDLLRDQQRVG